MSSESGTLDEAVSALFINPLSRKVEKTGHQWAPVIEKVIIVLIWLLAFSIRLFAVIRFESVIHEFDPYFNFRTTRFLAEEGFYEFWNWFDAGSWYPLGRVIGQTLYPGLMTTSAVAYYVLNFLGFAVNVRNVCVFIAPVFAGLTGVAAYLFSKEVTGRVGAGLFSALFISICPSYLSRSVAGSYDNEGVAIFALVLSFWSYVKAIQTGNMLHTLLAVLAYFYMVASWGGYIFITNTIAIYHVVMIMLGRSSHRHYVVYSVWYLLSTIMCMNVPFVNFAAIISSEHMASHGVFVMLNAIMFTQYLKALLPENAGQLLLKLFVTAVLSVVVALFVFLTMTGKTRWAGRSMTLLDPTYASKYIPIIASVSEHQPTVWSNYIMDMHMLPLLAPVGLYYCFKRLSDGSVFMGIYGILSCYFSGVMIRLLLVMAPAVSCLAGVAVSLVASTFISTLRNPSVYRKAAGIRRFPKLIALAVALFLSYWTFKYISHCVWASAFMYSHPSIVMAHTTREGNRVLQDDFREAYYWMRQNTPKDAKILSWWDYGYQITVMANRTVLVDNNTWNNTHIATVGLVLASTEEDAIPIIRAHDADYVLVIFGGMSNYPSDDINKFLWPVRIASGVYPDKVHEKDFIGRAGYTIDSTATPRMLNSVIYKLSFHRVAEVTRGYDMVRRQQIGNPDIKLKYFEEAFTSENWIVRIYKVKKQKNRGDASKSRYPVRKRSVKSKFKRVDIP